MKKIITVVMTLVFLSSNVYAEDCKWATGIKKTEGGYLYSDSCHNRVGLLNKDIDDYKIQVDSLKKSIEFKDLALQKSDQRADMWMNTTFKVEDRLNNLESAANKNKWVYYGLGVLTVFAAGYAAKQVYGGR